MSTNWAFLQAVLPYFVEIAKVYRENCEIIQENAMKYWLQFSTCYAKLKLRVYISNSAFMDMCREENLGTSLHFYSICRLIDIGAIGTKASVFAAKQNRRYSVTDKKLKRMSRTELLELLIEQMEENERLKAELEETLTRLNEQQITIQRAGSIAKAALELNKVFEAADAAARQYVESVCRIADEKRK